MFEVEEEKIFHNFACTSLEIGRSYSCVGMSFNV